MTAVLQTLEPWLTREVAAILQADSHVDAKSRFQEWAQAELSITPVYEIIGEDGPDHAKTFTARVLLNVDVAGIGQGPSKRAAEQMAAQSALEARAPA